MAKPMLEQVILEEVHKLPSREKHTVLDFVRFLAAKREEKEADEVVDLTADVREALREVKAGLGRPAKELLDEL
jgi:hypothetical protein